MLDLQKFYSKTFLDKTPEGKIRLQYTTLSMVSNLFEILKAMMIQSDEEAFNNILTDLKNQGDMRTFLKLVSSLLNPTTEMAWANVK